MAKRTSRSKPAREAASTTQARMLDTLHRIWLAGLGAAVKAQRGAPRLMDELVEEGARVHSETRGAAEQALRDLLGDTRSRLNARISQVRGQAGDALDNLEKIFQTRVHRALTQLGVPSAEEVEALSAKVEALNGSIEQLNRSRKAVRARPPTRKAATAVTVAPAP